MGNSHPLARAFSPKTAGGVNYFVDRFSIFQGTVHLAGWAFCETHKIKRAFLLTPPGDCLDIKSYGLKSEDLAQRYGVVSLHARFDETIQFTGDSSRLLQAFLCLEMDNGMIRKIVNFYGPNIAIDPAHQLFGEFKKYLAVKGLGNLLEIGSRARSGITRREIAPQGWSYTGFDIIDGDSVDVAGDAHKLSTYFPGETYDAVMSFSVLEHLLMPWKFIVELNRVMKVDAVLLFMTPQCWPLWDFWRFSSESWPALLNNKTGFEIIDARMGEPAFVVAKTCHPATDFSENSMGYLASRVLFKKTGETTRDWPVDPDEIIKTRYPKGP